MSKSLADGLSAHYAAYAQVDPETEFTRGGIHNGEGGWPIVSDALAVHHDQVQEATESARRKGVETEFRKDGRPVLRNREHRRQYLKAYGFHDRNSYTGH